MKKNREFAQRMRNINGDTVNSILKFMGDPNIISFGGGSPAKEAFPTDVIREILDKALTDNGAGMLQYGVTAGIPSLRQAYIEHILADKGVCAAMENIISTTGGTQGLDLLTQAFLNPGDTILVEDLTFLSALTVFRKLEAHIVPVKTDDEGIVIEDLQEKARALRPKMLYVIPTFQNPTGRTLLAGRRRRIAELAAQYDFIVAEDDPYCDLRFRGEVQPAIKSFDEAGNVVMMNSFSKIISPGLRVGMLAADPDIIEKAILVKQCADTHTTILTQHVCAEFLNRGLLPGHLAAISPIYGARMQRMLEGIRQYFPKGCRYTQPEGGLFIWVELPNDIDTLPLMAKCATEIQVAFVPGSPFAAQAPVGRNCLRLNFSSNSPERIEEGMKKLGAFLCACCE